MDIQLYRLAPELFLVSSALAEAGAQYIEDEVGAHNILNKLRVELNKKTAYPLTLSPQVFYLGASAPQNILTRFHDKQDISGVFNSISWLAGRADFIMLYARQTEQIFSFITFGSVKVKWPIRSVHELRERKYFLCNIFSPSL